MTGEERKEQNDREERQGMKAGEEDRGGEQLEERQKTGGERQKKNDRVG